MKLVTTASAIWILVAAPVFAQSPGMKDMDMKRPMPTMAEKGRVHKGTGVVKSIDARKGTVTLSHEPIQSMNWPSMTMSFKARDAKLVEGLSPGKTVTFEFVQEGKDSVITAVK